MRHKQHAGSQTDVVQFFKWMRNLKVKKVHPVPLVQGKKTAVQLKYFNTHQALVTG